jgi:hypothetical protein
VGHSIYLNYLNYLKTLKQKQVSMRLIRELYKQQQLVSSSDTARTIRHTEKSEEVTEEKIPVDIRTVAVRILNKEKSPENTPLSEDRIQKVIELLKKQHPEEKFYDTQIRKRCSERTVLGGVDLAVQVRE